MILTTVVTVLALSCMVYSAKSYNRWNYGSTGWLAIRLVRVLGLVLFIVALNLDWGICAITSVSFTAGALWFSLSWEAYRSTASDEPYDQSQVGGSAMGGPF